jgi:hypothetical protein
MKLKMFNFHLTLTATTDHLKTHETPNYHHFISCSYYFLRRKSHSQTTTSQKPEYEKKNRRIDIGMGRSV